MSDIEAEDVGAPEGDSEIVDSGTDQMEGLPTSTDMASAYGAAAVESSVSCDPSYWGGMPLPPLGESSDAGRKEYGSFKITGGLP